MKYFYFSDRIFHSHIHLYFNCTLEELEKHLQKKLKNSDFKITIEKTLDGCYFTLEKDKNQMRIIWVEKFDWSVSSQAVLAHELIHFIMATFNDKDIPIKKENEETFAYYYAHYYTEIWWKLRNLNPAYKVKKKHSKSTKVSLKKV